jgi:hypothetical protein
MRLSTTLATRIRVPRTPLVHISFFSPTPTNLSLKLMNDEYDANSEPLTGSHPSIHLLAPSSHHEHHLTGRHLGHYSRLALIWAGEWGSQ